MDPLPSSSPTVLPLSDFPIERRDGKPHNTTDGGRRRKNKLFHSNCTRFTDIFFSALILQWP
jgi:hypothetical protein